MIDGSVFYTPMFYNPQASETILSPESICFHSGGILDSWTQSGSTVASHGSVSFFDSMGAEVLAFTLQKRNGLYYTDVSAYAVDSDRPTLNHTKDFYIYFHSPDDDVPDDISIGSTDSFSNTHPNSHQKSQDLSSVPSSISHGKPQDHPSHHPPDSPPPLTYKYLPPVYVPTPKSHRSIIDEFVPKSRQLEADLWQARLGHCSDWQLKVLPMSADGLPSRFYPHPFASYDHYNQARIRKRPATRGKHPSRAVTRQQRFYMDFGYLRASTFDFSRPDKSSDRVVTSFDGYNSYLLIIDEFTKYVWIYLCVSKEPPIAMIHLHLDQFGSKSGHIRCDKGGELAGCAAFVSGMAERGFVVEPTGSDSPEQNKQAEKWNDIFGVTVRVLLYGSGLPAIFWSAALIHAAYLHNRRVHKAILMTPFEAWHGFKPDLRRLRVFGSRVCVKRTGKRRSKLDQHSFSGIFLGYTATDENIRYIDVQSRLVQTSHHAIFDEAWYHQPKRPPFAQMLYDVGLEPEIDLSFLHPSSDIFAPQPPIPPLSPSPPPKPSVVLPLPLRVSVDPNTYAAAAALTVPSVDPVSDAAAPLHKRRIEHEMIMAHDISHRDLDMVYLSPSSYNNAFEEVLDLRRFDPLSSPTAGLECILKDNKLILTGMTPSSPAAKIRAWRSRIRGARLLEIESTPVSSIDDITTCLLRLAATGSKQCRLLFAHSALRDGLVETGIPQINVDQLNNRFSFQDIDVMTQEQFDRWFSSLPTSFYELVDAGGVLNLTTSCHKLTRRTLLEQHDWSDWEQSEWKQLDQYEKQFMFGEPCPMKRKDAVFNLIWTYVVKTEDGRKKARCTCDGSTRGGAVRVLDHTHANSLDQTGSRIFYALSAVENLLVFGSDVSNAFGEAPPPKQGFFIRPDKAFHG
jgi:hypothetical protein